MAEYKEIVTKAVIAKGKKSTSNKYTLEPEEIPNTILGCWVINNTFNGTSVGDSIIVNGSFDVNVWYSYDNDSKTAVSTKKYNYSDTMHMKSLNSLDSRPEVLVKSLKQPTVADVKIDNGVVNLSIDKELGIEIVGNTKIKVPVETLDDDYEILEDDPPLEEIDKVNEDYLK
ncbi:MAG: outer spore coat protein CotE [Bacilli bacterium]|jgi:spore coat protein E|nr:outer spore coat protein CotE [Bacilli bacterium]CCZ89773.1 spore coat protein CotE [Coprobacillus sp. CAG:605]